MIIEIPDRLYNEFTQWALLNNMTEADITPYIISAFRNKFMLDKYGDLNEKLTPKPKPKKSRTKTKNKEISEQTEDIIIKQIVIEEKPTVEIISEETPEISTVVEEKPKRKRKTLQTL